MGLFDPGVFRRVIDVTAWPFEAFLKAMIMKIGNLMGIDLPSIFRNLRLYFRVVLVRDIPFFLL